MSALIRYQQPTWSLSELFDDLFSERSFSSAPDITGTSWPRVDIIENDNDYAIHADLPGLEKKDISVTVENGILTIAGEKNSERKSEKKDHYRYFERSYGKFSRSFQLPEHVDVENIDATYNNGTLELTLKKTEKAKPKAIEVKLS